MRLSSLIIICFLVGLTLHGQGPYTKLEHLSIEDGLSQSSITSIWQDQYGMMWLGTEDGLNRYDGYQFTHYKHKPYTSGTLDGSRVTSITEDHQGVLWVSTNNGINRFNPLDQTIKSFYLVDGDQSKTIVLNSLHLSEKQILIATNRSLVLFNPTTEEFETVTTKVSSNTPLHTRALLQFDEYKIWHGNYQGLQVYDTQSRSVDPMEGALGVYCRNKVVHDIIKDHHGNIWIAVGHEVVKYNPLNAHFDVYNFGPNQTSATYYLMQDRQGNIWVGGTKRIPHVLTPGASKFTPLQVAEGFQPFPGSTCMFEDESGIIWIGTYGGIYKIDPGRWKFQHYKQSHLPLNGIQEIAGIRAFTEAADGSIYVGASGTGLHKFDPVNKTLQDQNHLLEQFSDYQKVIKTLLWDSHHNLWVGTWTNGIYRLNMKTGVNQHIKADGSPNGLQIDGVRHLLEDHQGDVWIATYQGLNRYRHQTNQFELYLSKPDSSGLTDSGIQILFEDSEQNLWAGTTNGGLNRYLPETNSFKGYFHHPDDPSGISYNYITSIAEAPKGILWIGTYGGGLNRLDVAQEQFTHYNSANSALPNDVIYGILVDTEDQLWISSNAGLTRLDPISDQFRNYDVNDGLQSNEFNSGAYFRSSDGHHYFGGIDGFNAFDPGEVRDNQHIPKVLFTDFQINNQSVVPTKNGVIEKPIANAERIVLDHNQTVFSFEFVALNYTDPQKNQFAYMLEGFDRQWQYLGHRNFITFTNIDPGTYKLLVKGSNNDGVWNPQPLALEIQILPPWWRSNWAYAGYLLLFLGAMWWWRKQVINRANLKAKLVLEQLKLEKISELDRAKSIFFENISHEFRTPLTLIQNPLESIYKKGVPQHLSMLYKVMINNTRRLRQLIDQLLDLSKLESGKMSLELQYQDLVPLVRTCFELFEHQKINPKLNFQLKILCETLWFYCDGDKVQKMVTNLISNAVKFTTEGTITIKLWHDQTHAIISVEDTGPGIPAHLKEKIFDRFYNTSGPHVEASGTGIGLALTKELVDLHFGHIMVSSKLGQGATFTVRLPLAVHDHLKTKPPLNSPTPVQQPKLPVVPLDHWQPDETSEAMFTILVVEDQVELRGFLKHILSEHYQVITAAHGKEGLDLALEHGPDLIISDVRMPVMDGFTFCQEIKSDLRTSHIPVILLTAKSGKPNKLKGFNLGADDYLVKPFDEDELMAILRNRVQYREKLRKQFSRAVYLEPSRLALTSADEKFLSQALQVMESNMDNPEFRVAAFLKEMGLSRTQMHRKLRALTDQSTTEFMRSIRLKRAAQMLKENMGNVSEVSDAVGFSRVSTFISEFKKVYEVTPLQYRKIHFLEPKD